MKNRLWIGLLFLIAGFILGLIYAWIISPIRYIDASPNTLRADFKEKFRSTIAAAYAATHNLERAKARLALLGDLDPIQTLSAQAQRMLANGESFEIVQQVASLAADLRSGVAAVLPSTTNPPSSIEQPLALTNAPSPSSTTPAAQISPPLDATSTVLVVSTQLAFDTPTPRPTRTPLPTQGAPYQLISQDNVCNPNLTDGLMQIDVMDSQGHQVPGVEIIISSGPGEEHFFTGLKPEIADGYADYIMQADVTYTLRVGPSGHPISSLSAPGCPDTHGQTYTGGLKLTFQQQ